MSRKATPGHPPVDQPGYLSRFRVYHHVCDTEICVSHVERSRGFDLGRVQRPDDIVNFEHPINRPSI